MRTTFTFSQKVHCYRSQRGAKRLKTLTPQGLFSFPFSPPSPPSFPSLSLSSDPSMPSKELLLAPPPKMKTRVGQALAHLVSGPGVEDTSFLGKKNWLHKMMALVIVHNDVGWMGPPGKEELVAQPLSRHRRHLLHTPFHNPTPLTGTKNRLVPCMNSSLLFIPVSGSDVQFL